MELRKIVPYLGIFPNRDSTDVLVNVKNFVSLKSFLKQVTDSRIIVDLKIVFLKPYNLTLLINLCAEAEQFPITVKPT